MATKWARDWECCQECGTTERPHKGHGLCETCYDRQRERPIITCQECGKEKPHTAHGLCNTCYQRQHEQPIITCKECGKERPHAGHGLCKTCYNRQHEHPLIICKECGEERLHHAHGLCKACYYRQWREENLDKKRANNRRYRARKRNATIKPVDEATIYELYDNTCVYCGATENLELDHIVPLNGSGAHCEDNLVVACRSCNASKGDKPLMEWLQTQPRARAWVI